MKIRVSDYIVKVLESIGIDTTFCLTGGFAMHLNDSFGKSTIIKTYYHHHEQACGYAALGYTKTNNKPSVVCTTSGVAASNSISPCLDAYQDSVSILFISGQVKTFDTIRAINLNTEDKLRNYAFSDCDIISMVSSITKYSHEITNINEVKLVIQNAIINLTTGRPGPVWLSIPLDIQAMLIEDDIPDYSISKSTLKINLEDVYNLLKESTRPVILAGNGIKLGNCQEKFIKFVNDTGIPVTTSYLGSDVIETASKYFIGRVGLYADRSGNFTIQNSDLVIVLGCRLSNAVVGYNPKTFAREAKIIYIDIDPNELKKKSISYTITINLDLNEFFDTFSFITPNYSDWLEKCNSWKKKWLFEIPANVLDTEIINPYYAVKCLFDKLPENKIVTTGSGSIAIIVNQLLNIKKNDTFIWSGHGDMGTDLPMSIGSHIANKTKQFILFTGEGTFQFNIQELQTIIHHKFPIKIIVFNNASYAAIEITQKTFFNNKFGVDVTSGLSFPDTEKIAKAYNIQYMSASVNSNLNTEIDKFIEIKENVIFEIFCCIQGRYPKMSAVKNEDGTFTSRPFEDMEPFLDREEFFKEMIVKPI
jgi:acetolactate synthase-1/2/3 large subunit